MFRGIKTGRIDSLRYGQRRIILKPWRQTWQAEGSLSLPPRSGWLTDRRGLAKMVCLHGYPATAVADVFHGRELVFADVLRINLRCAAETALLGIATGVAQVTGLIGHRAAGLTRVGHGISPFSQVVFRKVGVRQNRAHPTGKNEAGNVKSAGHGPPFPTGQGERGDGIAAPGVILANF